MSETHDRTGFWKYVALLFRKTGARLRASWPKHLGGLATTAGLPGILTYVFTQDRTASEVTLYVGSVVVGCGLVYEFITVFFVSGRDLFDGERSRALSAERYREAVILRSQAHNSPRPFVSLGPSPEASAAPFALKAGSEGTTALNFIVVGGMFGRFHGLFTTPDSLRPGETADVGFLVLPNDNETVDETFEGFIRRAAAYYLEHSDVRKTGFTQLEAVGNGAIAAFRLSIGYQDFHGRSYLDFHDVTCVWDGDKFVVNTRFLESHRSELAERERKQLPGTAGSSVAPLPG